MRSGRYIATVLSILFAATAAVSQSLPETTFFAVNTKGELVSFKSSKPSKMLKVPKLTGMQKAEWLVGIDFRASNKMLYGVTNQSRVYTINTTTGVATAVGNLTTMLTGEQYGVDFNPVPDRLRIISNTDQNLRANPADGVNVVDKPLLFAATDANNGKDPFVSASAYTNNFAGTKGTALYNIDSSIDALLLQNPPNDGVLNTVGPLGFKITANAGFDIVWSGEMNFGVAALQAENAKTSSLYWIDLKSGAAASIGKIGSKHPIVGLTASL